MFDRDRFIADCLEALPEGQPAVRAVIARAVSDPASLVEALGEPQAAPENRVEFLYRSEAITIINLVWSPGHITLPHDHRMWAVIGMYGGREDNLFWRRLPPDARYGIEAAGAKCIHPGEALALGPEIIHSVVNPLAGPTAALHVYGGDFPPAHRSQWNALTLQEEPFGPLPGRILGR
jgi:predicted metal-dependent enzyme (double-stranded beta helix superfamily)